VMNHRICANATHGVKGIDEDCSHKDYSGPVYYFVKEYYHMVPSKMAS
jgi:hypothetical protein